MSGSVSIRCEYLYRSINRWVLHLYGGFWEHVYLETAISILPYLRLFGPKTLFERSACNDSNKEYHVLQCPVSTSKRDSVPLPTTLDHNRFVSLAPGPAHSATRARHIPIAACCSIGQST